MSRPKRTAHFLHWLPDPPAAPDYSTPEAVTARAQEAALAGGCTHPDHWPCKHWDAHVKMLRAVRTALKTDGKVYRDFQRAVEAAQGRQT